MNNDYNAARSKRRTSSRKSRRCLIFLIILVLLLGAVFSVHYLTSPMNASSEGVCRIDILPGSSTMTIAEELKDNCLIRSVTMFKLISRMKGYDGQYKAGYYEFPESMSMTEIMDGIIDGKQKLISITIPEGFTLQQTAERVAESGLFTEEEFLKETAEGTFDFKYNAEAGSGANRYEGFLFPDTYQLTTGDSAHTLIQMMLNQFECVYDEEATGSETSSEWNVSQLVTVASLVEREAKLDKERPLVASVIYNRLAKGMKLQFCSTVQYALGTPKARLFERDLATDSPYNTYLYEGLPPGSIASPGRASLNAALHPAETDYLYFVLESAGSDTHNFASAGDEFASYKADYLSSLS